MCLGVEGWVERVCALAALGSKSFVYQRLIFYTPPIHPLFTPRKTYRRSSWCISRADNVRDQQEGQAYLQRYPIHDQ